MASSKAWRRWSAVRSTMVEDADADERTVGLASRRAAAESGAGCFPDAEGGGPVMSRFMVVLLVLGPDGRVGCPVGEVSGGRVS
jgi:hypothetical protein